jgi:hypothetical protein
MIKKTRLTILTEHFENILTAEIACIRSSTRHISHAQTILNILKRRVKAGLQADGTDDERIHQYAKTWQNVLREANASTLSVDTEIDETNIRDMIAFIETLVTVEFGAYIDAVDVWSMLDSRQNPASLIGINWPPKMMDHIVMLRNTIYTLREKGPKLGTGMIVVGGNIVNSKLSGSWSLLVKYKLCDFGNVLNAIATPLPMTRVGAADAQNAALRL